MNGQQVCIEPNPCVVLRICDRLDRCNGEFRDREKVMRGLKKKDTPILKGYEIYHNFVRPHMALDGRTPCEACGIEVKGENKWKTLIANSKMS